MVITHMTDYNYQFEEQFVICLTHKQVHTPLISVHTLNIGPRTQAALFKNTHNCIAKVQQ